MAKNVVKINNHEFETYDSPLGGTIFFTSFESTEQMNNVVVETEDWMAARRQRWYAEVFRNGTKTAYGASFEGSTDVDLMNNPNQISAFNYQNLLDSALNGLANIEQNLELGGGLKKKKLIMSSQPIGVFNFPAASVGLYRKAEYFSPSDNAVIDKSLVKGSVDKGFFYTESGQKKLLEQRQENTTEMLRLNPDAVAKKTASGMLYTDPIKYKNLMLKFGTTTRKVYLIKSDVKNIEKRGKEKYVDFYINAAGLGDINPTNIFYGSLPSVIAAKILEDAGFKVKIHKLVSNTQGRSSLMYSAVIKDYGQPIDINKILVQCGDPRTFRWQDFRNFSAFSAAVLNTDYGMGFGSSLDTGQLRLAFNDYKAWKRKKIERGELKEFNKNMRLHLNAGFRATNRNESQQLQEVEQKLKFLLDSVATEFSGSEQAIKDAIKRDIGKLSKQQIIQNFQTNLESNEMMPRQPADAELHIPDNEFQNIVTQHQNNISKFKQIKPTL